MLGHGSTALEEVMLERLDRTWINGWTGQMARILIFIISRVMLVTDIVSFSSTMSIASTVFCVTQGTMIAASSYVRYAFTQQNVGTSLTVPNWTGVRNGALA
jgi:hypothetical protein